MLAHFYERHNRLHATQTTRPGRWPYSAQSRASSVPKRPKLRRHASHCTICKHPERDAIEEAFLHWWRPVDLAAHFKLGSRLVVYRHSHALGLFQRRAARTQHALGYIIEQAESVTATADSVIRAVRVLGCLDDEGRWVEPAKRVIVTHQHLDTRVEKKMALIPSESAT
jgi:hypothetical protein